MPRVLIVEDQDYHRGGVAALIERLGEHFELIGDGKGVATMQGAERVFASDERVDLLVLDLDLPYRNLPESARGEDLGIELGNWVRRRYPQTAIVVVTANPKVDALERCRSFTHYVVDKEILGPREGVLERVIRAALEGAPSDETTTRNWPDVARWLEAELGLGEALIAVLKAAYLVASSEPATIAGVLCVEPGTISKSKTRIAEKVRDRPRLQISSNASDALVFDDLRRVIVDRLNGIVNTAP